LDWIGAGIGKLGIEEGLTFSEWDSIKKRTHLLLLSSDIFQEGKSEYCFYECGNETQTYTFSEKLSSCESGYTMKDCSLSV
jgi:hypothetical protein